MPSEKADVGCKSSAKKKTIIQALHLGGQHGNERPVTEQQAASPRFTLIAFFRLVNMSEGSTPSVPTIT